MLLKCIFVDEMIEVVFVLCVSLTLPVKGLQIEKTVSPGQTSA